MIKNSIEKTRELIKLIIKNTPFSISFENLGYVPRWLVLWFDIQITVFVLLVVGLITNNFNFDYLSLLFVPKTLIAVAVTFVFFLLFKTYVGLIRHSSYIDAVKLFFASFFSTIVLAIIDYINFSLNDWVIYEPVFLILFPLILFVSLFLFRAFVKQAYTQFLAKSHTSLEKVFILGISQSAISLAVAIENEFPKKFKVLGFLGGDEKAKNKQIFGMPILTLKKKPYVLIRSHKATGLIVLDNDLKNENYRKYIEDCIEHNIKIYRAPSISEFSLSEGINKSIHNIQIEDLLDREPISINNNRIIELIQNKTILVTGGAGSIGSEIVFQLAKFNPKKLIVVDQAETPLHDLTLKISEAYKNLNFEPIICDIRNEDDLENLFKTYNPNIIYHCAAYKHVPMMEKNPSQAVSVNILGTKILADLALKHHVDRFVMISTDKAVNPSNVMGATKRVAEMYVQSLYNSVSKQPNSTKFITTRFGNVLGSNGSVVPLFKKQIQEGGPVTITHPDIIRYFMTIPEACQLVIEASSMGSGGEIFIFDMGKAVKILDLAKKMIRLAGFIPEKNIKIVAIGLRPGEKLYEELLNDKSITMPTYHEKIMIVKENNNQYDYVSIQVNEIINSAKNFDHTDTVQKIKVLVPEFKSLNSMYEKLDV